MVVKCISMMITTTASRKIAFKAANTSEIAFETQSAFVARGVGGKAFFLINFEFKNKIK